MGRRIGGQSREGSPGEGRALGVVYGGLSSVAQGVRVQGVVHVGRSSGRTPTGLSRVSQISGGQGIGSGLCGAEGYKEQSKVGGSSVAHTTWGSSPRETEQGAGSRSSTEQGTGHSPHGTKQGSPHASVYEE